MTWPDLRAGFRKGSVQFQLENYVNGSFSKPISGKYITLYNPAVGLPFAEVPDSGKEDIELAYQAASVAFPKWKNTPAEAKFQILNRIAELIDLHHEYLAECESADQGKPIWLAKNEMKRAAQNFRFFATASQHMASEAHITEDQAVNYTIRQPIGVVGCISPWNLPLYLFSWKIAPALASGNCVIAKPSEITPLTAYLLSYLCQEAGLPDGVLNIIHGGGPSCGEAIIKHPGIKAISFTGGSATGKHLASVAAPMFKKLSLELGGKNPTIIFADCDFEKMIRTTVNSATLNQGEICLCGSRIYVERSIYPQFKERYIRALNELKVGDPSHPDSKLGAIVSKAHFDKVMAAIALAKEEGGTILTGGHAIQPEGLETGWYIAPTLIEGLSNTCATQQQEIFGPVVTLTPFDSEEEVIQLANDSQYGLAAGIWTENLNRAHRVAAMVQCGIIWINCWLLRDLRTPFGGMKSSGVGREGGWEAIRFLTEPKNVCIKLD